MHAESILILFNLKNKTVILTAKMGLFGKIRDLKIRDLCERVFLAVGEQRFFLAKLQQKHRQI